ncbi:CGNR zinc finger domain-containing protein [Actinacidiphila glaucinigra]|uniref:CGNR zinc finger domain-containing protein n=1 Tax=Actinacidiphila glaucinigra TaxID=235986 RepID=UPI00379E715A
MEMTNAGHQEDDGVGGVMGEEVTTSAVLLGEPLPIELMNTVSVDGGRTRDALADDTDAVDWLRAVSGRLEAETGIRPGPLDAEGIRAVARSLRALRDALRRLASETTGDPRSSPSSVPKPDRQKAISTLNALARAWPELRWPADGPISRVYRGDGGETQLAVQVIARQAVELLTGPDRDHLRPCLAPNCLLFFADGHARREWCSPVCGNRARVARHYRRHHTSGVPLR